MSKWWLLIALGVAAVVVGLASSQVPVLVVGAVVAIVGVAGQGRDYVELDLLRGKLRLEKQSPEADGGKAAVKLERAAVESALLEMAGELGVNSKEARRMAGAVAARIPPSGAPITLSKSGNAVARLGDDTSFVVRVREGRELTGELLSREFVDAAAPDWKRRVRLLEIYRERGYDKDDTILNTATVGDHGPETTDLTLLVAHDLLAAVADQIDPAKRYLVYSRGEGDSLNTVEVRDGTRLLIGRESTCDLVIPDMSVSEEHALLVVSADGMAVRITDLNSTNGVQVNRARVSQGKLKSGDLIKIGDVDLLYAGPGFAAATGAA